jgi:hypothetical protein
VLNARAESVREEVEERREVLRRGAMGAVGVLLSTLGYMMMV